ncbi:uncharacterized protein FIESC28_01127 [Fusarium coffeatum]|uniref:Condensation domain-containing protein n=1 Tax=Fusarium coffeatum TaxID=231269 RepID=A0A366S9Z2_9HYPO|nr:uncharacterized protein FIESC28_01127 [Fusarium coffeatum]RBR26099.1 hypothetical protein FIESC28_01127 [Fusarium coffeatum]
MPFDWRQISPTVFENDRGTFEELYYYTQGEFGKPAPFILYTTVKFKNHDGLAPDQIETSLRNAWSQTRRTQPQIAARHGETGKVIEIFRGQALDDWLSETFLVYRETTLDDIFRDSGSRRYATLFYFPTTRELTLQINHAWVDGRGALFFWDTFFSALANPSDAPVTPEDVKKNLPVTIDTILDIPGGTSPEVLGPANKILERISTDNAIFTPADSPDTPLKGFFRRQRKLDPEVSSKVIAALKKRGMTVTAAIQVAFGIAVQEYQREKTGKAGDVWASCANIDARRFFPEEYTAELKRVACHYTLLPLYVPISAETFDKTAIELSDYYRKALKHPDAEGALCVPAAMPLYMQTVAEGAAFLRTPLLTSLGIVEDFMGHRFGEWEIEDFWLANTMMPPSVQVFIWTWRGQVVFGGSWNEAMFGADVIEGLLERTEDILSKGLQLE